MLAACSWRRRRRTRSWRDTVTPELPLDALVKHLRRCDVGRSTRSVARLLLCDAATVKVASVSRVEPYGGVVVAEGVAETTTLQVDETSAVERVRIVGVQPQGLAAVAEGRVQLSRERPRPAAAVPVVRVGRCKLDRA